MSTTIGVDADLCQGCGECVDACPQQAIHVEGGVAVIDQEICDACEACFAACSQGAIYVVVDARQEETYLPAPAQESTVAETGLVAPPRVRPVHGISKEPRLSAGLSLARFLGREVLPRAVGAFLAVWDSQQGRRASSSQVARSGSPVAPAGKITGGRPGGRHRARHGRGRGGS